MSNVSFEWPWLLLSLMLIPALLIAYAIAQRRRKNYAVIFTNTDLLEEVAGAQPGLKRHIPPILFLIGLAALLLALARPVINLTVSRQRTAVMLVMDVSYSMNAEDLKPTRIAVAKQSAKHSRKKFFSLHTRWRHNILG